MKRAFSGIEGPSNPPPLGGLWADMSDAPSVPVQSSERGAEYATKKRLTVGQSATILQVLAAAGAVEGSNVWLSRDDIRDGYPELSVNAACGRLGRTAMLRQDGYVLAAEDIACSHAGLAVVGYQISRAGLALLSSASLKSAFRGAGGTTEAA